MQTMNLKTAVAVLGAAFMAILLVAGCNKSPQQLGQAIPSDVPSATLAEIQKNAAAYKDKEVLLTGNYGGHCCPTDFNYKEGLNGVECYYPGFDVPETKVGRPVSIYAIVRVRQEEGAKEPQVHLEAKGVEFK
jgi:hypothetical protein